MKKPIALLSLLFVCSIGLAETPFITVASTTSTEQSGLLSYLKEKILADIGFEVRVVAVGTGQALDMGRKGDADVLLVHDLPAENKFVAEGYGVKRYPVMHNDFVLIGPKNDPAQVKDAKDAAGAFKSIFAKQSPFVSRADKSGTYSKELSLWATAGITMPEQSAPWYRQTGSGMGPALNTAAQLNAYILADRGTWLSFKNRNDLVILFEGDASLFNPYGVILVNPKRFPHVKEQLGQRYIEWLLSAKGQKAIADYKIDGQGLFFPNPTKSR